MAPPTLDGTTVPGAPLNAGMPAGLPTPEPAQEPIVEAPAPPVAPPVAGPATAEPPPISTASELFSQDLGDYIDKDLLASLKASAMDDKMDVTTALGFAGLAMTSPDILTQIMQHKESGKQNARSLLTQLQGQISTARRTAMTAEASITKEQGRLDAKEKQDRYKANAASVLQTADRMNREGVRSDVPQPAGQDLYDDEKVQAFTVAGGGALETNEKRIKQVDTQIKMIERSVEQNLLDPKKVVPAMHSVFKNAGYTDQEIEEKFGARMDLTATAAEGMVRERAAKRAQMSAMSKGAEVSLALTRGKLDLWKGQLQLGNRKLTLEQQQEARLDRQNLETHIGRYMSWATTAQEDSALAREAAQLGEQLIVKQGKVQTQYAGLVAMNNAMALKDSVENIIGMIQQKQDLEHDRILGDPAGTRSQKRADEALSGVSVQDPRITGLHIPGQLRTAKQAAFDAVMNSSMVSPEMRSFVQRRFAGSQPVN